MQILLGVLPLWACVFSRLELAHEVQHVLADEVARNGAPLKINFGQRFSWTPLAFSLRSRHKPGRSTPSPTASLHFKPEQAFSSQNELFLNIKSRLPQQSRDHRLLKT